MVLKKSTPYHMMGYQVNYENENARLLILNAVKSRNAVISILEDGAEITEELALFIWHHSNKDKPLNITIGKYTGRKRVC